LLASLALFALIAACGGEESGDSGSSSAKSGGGSGGALVCIAYLLVSGNNECVSSITSSSSGSSSSSGDSSSSDSSSTAIRYVLNNEFEPNDDWLNANPLVMESSPAPDGFSADGDVNDVSDQADTYSFSRRMGRNFRFKLCSFGQRTCNEYGEIDTITAYIDVLDSNGNVIVSSQAAPGNLIETRIQAGLTYYVRVVAGDTMGATVSYHLTANEFE
jgi:hypothetical protein